MFGDVVSLLSIYLVIRAAFTGPIEPIQARRIRTIAVVLFLCLITYSLFLFLSHSPRQIFYMVRFGRALLQFLGCYSLVRIYYAKYGANFGKTILFHLYLAIAVHSIIMFGMYFNSSFRFFITSFAVPETHQSYNAMVIVGKRIGGLVSSLDGLSVVQSFGLLLIPFMIMIANKRQGILLVIFMPVIAFSVLISGRTGVVMLILSLPLTLVAIRRHIGKMLGYSFIAVIVITIASVFFVPGKHSKNMLAEQYNRLTGLFTSTEEGGQGLQKGATAKLIEDFKNDWPDEFGLFLFGNGMSGRSFKIIHADPGYILDMHGIGLFGTIPMVLYYIIAVGYAWRCRKICNYVALLSFIYSIMSLIINCKVRFLFARVGFTIQVLLFFATVYFYYLHKEVEIKDENMLLDYY